MNEPVTRVDYDDTDLEIINYTEFDLLSSKYDENYSIFGTVAVSAEFTTGEHNVAAVLYLASDDPGEYYVYDNWSTLYSEGIKVQTLSENANEIKSIIETYSSDEKLDGAIGDGLTAELSANDTVVTINGNLTGVKNTLELDIDSGVKVIWNATLKMKSEDEDLTTLLQVDGAGIFEMASGEIEIEKNIIDEYNFSTPVAVMVPFDTGASIDFIITGGRVAGISNRAGDGIGMYSEASSITVSGGTVIGTGDGSSYGTAIESMGDITISDNAIITSDCNAINCIGENATIIINGGTITGANCLYINYASNTSVVINNGNLTASGNYGDVIYMGNNGKITINNGILTTTGKEGDVVYCNNTSLEIKGGTLTAEGKGSFGVKAYASGVSVSSGRILATGEGSITIACEYSNLSITNGIITSTGMFWGIWLDNPDFNEDYWDNPGSYPDYDPDTPYEIPELVYGIIYADGECEFNISGGIIFGYSKGDNGDVSDIIYNYNEDPGDLVLNITDGILASWDSEKNTTEYKRGESTDLVVYPTGAEVKWAKSGDDNGINYKKSLNTGFLKVDGVTTTEADQTVAFNGVTGNAVSKTYGDAKFTQTATLSEGTGAVTYSSDTPVVATVNSSTGEVTILKPGTAKITASAAAVTGSWSKTDVSYTLTVSAKSLTVTAGTYVISKVYDGTTAKGAASGSLVTGILAADSSVTVTATPRVYGSKNAVSGNLTVDLALAGNTDGKYTLSSSTVSVPAKITKAPLTITGATVSTKTYDGTTTAQVTGVTFSGLKNSETLTLNTDYTATGVFSAASGSNKTVTITVTLKNTDKANNYSLVSGTYTLSNQSISNQNQNPPAAFTLTSVSTGDTTYTVTIPTTTGAEYSFDGTTWSGTNTKTNCLAGTTVKGYKRMAAKTGYNASNSVNNSVVLPLIQVKAPTATPNGGTFADSQSVTLSSVTTSTTIYYTIDGTQPTTASTKYTGAFTLNATTTVKAIAVKANMTNSTVMSVTFTKNAGNQNQNAPAAFTLTYVSTGDTTYTVTIPTTTGAEYSFDGTTWSGTNTKTNCLAGTTVKGYKRMAAKTGYNASEAVSDSVQLPFNKVKTPASTPNSGTFTDSQTVVLTSATENAMIYYTLNGTQPTVASLVYSEPIIINNTTTIKAIAIKKYMDDSEIMTTILTKAAEENQSLGGGGGGSGSAAGTSDVRIITNGKNATIGVAEIDVTKATETTKNGTVNLTISITDEQLKKALRAGERVDINLDISDAILKNKIINKKLDTISILVKQPDNSNLNINSVILSQSSVKAAMEAGKTIRVVERDSKGKALAQWEIDPAATAATGDVKFTLSISNASDNKKLADKLAKDTKNAGKGAIITIDESIPAGTDLKVKLEDVPGLKTGGKAVVYRLNEKTGKLEDTLIGEIKISKSGFVTLPNISGGSYVILPAKVNIATPIVNQVTATVSKKQLIVGKSVEVKINNIPYGMEIVTDFIGDPNAMKITLLSNSKNLLVDPGTGTIKAKKSGDYVLTIIKETPDGTQKISKLKIHFD